MSADLLLSRLERVRKCGGGWIARCPAHDDKSASLSVADKDGRVLIHCFAGCSPHDVLTSAGLNMQDLFERHDFATMTRAERASIREMKRIPEWRAAMNMTIQEIGVVCAALAMAKQSGRMTMIDAQRVSLAWNRIEAARGTLGFTPEIKRRAA